LYSPRTNDGSGTACALKTIISGRKQKSEMLSKVANMAKRSLRNEAILSAVGLYRKKSQGLGPPLVLTAPL
jgi:hypothetical protein